MGFWNKTASESDGSVEPGKANIGGQPVGFQQTNNSSSQTGTNSKSDVIESQFGGEKSVRYRALFPPGTTVSGKINLEFPARIDGDIRGEVFCSKPVIVEATAKLVANIEGTNVTIAGRVEGNVHCVERLEIKSSATVVGNLAAPVLMVEPGASVNGQISLTGSGIRSTGSPITDQSPGSQAGKLLAA